MDAGSLAVSALLFLSGLLGVTPVPKETPDWTVTKAWAEEGGVHAFAAESTSLPEACAERGGYLVLPMTLHGAHKLFVDGRPVETFGDSTFRSRFVFYNAPAVPCDRIRGRLLRWEVYAYGRYLARFRAWPRVEGSLPASALLNSTALLVSAGAFLVLGVFSAIVFSALPRRFVLSFSIGCVSISVFLYLSGGGGPWPTMSMLAAQQTADVGLALGLALLFYTFLQEGWLTLRMASFCLSGMAAGLLLVVMGTNSDEAQLGTTVVFPFFAIAVTAVIASLVRQGARSGWSRAIIYPLLAVALFAATSLHDIVLTIGLTSTPSMTSVGFLGSVLALATSINHRVSDAFAENERLRVGLEQEVERKTAQLAATMQTAMDTQARRLQWLGFMARFLQHELRNAVVGVETSVSMIGRLDVKRSKAYVDRALSSAHRIRGLLSAVSNASSVESMVATASLKPIDLSRTISARLDDLASIHPDAQFVTRVERNVVAIAGEELVELMVDKLVNNAVEHAATGTSISVSLETLRGDAVLRVSDLGDPLPVDAERIFDLGASTKGGRDAEHFGIGLYLVKLIAERHRGRVDALHCEPPQVGAEFVVSLPLLQDRNDAASCDA